MTMPDPNAAIRPSESSGGEADAGQRLTPETLAPQEERPIEDQTANDSRPSESGLASSPDAPPAPQAENEKQASAKPTALQSFGDLLRAAYGDSYKRLSPKKPEIAAMRSAPKLEPPERDELLALAALDRTLERTRELMSLSMERFAGTALSGQVDDFVREALRRHPAFFKEPIAGALENSLDELGEESAVRTLASQNYVTLTWPQGTPALNKKEAEQCRMNALWCFFLLRGTTLERILRLLQSNVWAHAARYYDDDQKKLKALMNTRDVAGIVVVCSVIEKQIHERDQQVASARMAEEHAIRRTEELEKNIETLKNQIEDAKAQIEDDKVQIERLTEEINRERRTHGDEKAHMRNDYEELRGRVMRRLREEVTLLDQGLQALRRDPPKVHVMVDHAERAIDGLKREMDRIKGDD